MTIDELLDSCITDMQTIANSAGDESVCEEVAYHAANKIADARKVAHDLLSALREMVELYGDNAQYDDSDEQCEVKAIADARTAIAKAETIRHKETNREPH